MRFLYSTIALLFPCLASLAAPLVGIGQNFIGSTLGLNDAAIPPDTEGAVGPDHFVELINGRFAVYSKSSGGLVSSMTDLSFWSQAGITFPRHWDVTDPRIIYDPSVQRWFAAQLDFDPTGFINTNRLLLAVSADANPLGTWNAVAIPGDPGGNNLADFLTMGLDGQGIYLAANLFDPSGDMVGTTLLSFPKTALLLNPPVVINRTWFGVLPYSNRGYILQPAVCLDGTIAGNVLSTAGLGYNLITESNVTNTSLFSCTIQNAAGPGSATLPGSISLPVPGYTAPFYPYQPDGSSNLDPGDSRFSANVYRVANVLFAVHSTVINNLDAIRWYRINATNNLLLEWGSITDPTMDLFYPSIAANTNGTIVIGFNGSSPYSYISCYAVVGQTVNGQTTFGSPLLLQSGSASYQDTPDADPSTYISRWGDYSATMVDPVDPTTFWTIQMYPSDVTVWSTQITQLFTVPGPVPLSVTQPDSNNLLVSWSGTSPLLQLQSSSNPASDSSWSAVTQTPVPVGNLTTVLVPNSGQGQFFRLVTAP